MTKDNPPLKPLKNGSVDQFGWPFRKDKKDRVKRYQKGDRVGLGFPAYVGNVIKREGTLVTVEFDNGITATYDEWQLVRLK